MGLLETGRLPYRKTVSTDHKPLVPILDSKNFEEMSPRIQRLRMRLLRFDFTASHIPGKSLITADALSRTPVEQQDGQSSTEEEIDLYVQHVLASLPASNTQLERIKEKQEEDEVCQTLKQYCSEGWSDRTRVPDALKPLVSFKRDKNIGNFLVRSSFQTNDQPGTFKCARARCKTCPFIHNANKISGPKRSIKITDHFTCTSANVIYCITCTYCKKIYIGETGRRLGDRFREHLRDVERNDKDASKPVARHFNLPNHSKQHMAICGLSLHLGSSESRKTLEQKFIFQIGTLNPIGINERFSFY